MTLSYPSYFKTPLWAALLTAFVATLAPNARAQTALSTCITGPAVVPGLAGTPKWFGPAATTASLPANPSGSRPELDDPRWAGAPLMPFAATMSSAAPTYRILRSTNALFLSFHAPVASSGSDVVYFGFSEGVGPTNPNSTAAYLIAITPAPAGAGPDPIPTQGVVVYKYTPTASTPWQLLPSTPTWLSDVATFRSADTGLAFGVNFKIAVNVPPLSPGVAIPRTGTFHAFFGMGIGVEPEGVVEYATPAVLPTTTFVADGIRVPRNHSEWGLYDGIAVPCRDGITLDTYNIHTGHPDGCSLYTGVPFSQNTISVEPQSIRGVDEPLLNDAVRVELALSDWGALPADATAPWKPIAGTEGGQMTSGAWTWSWGTGSGDSPMFPDLVGANIGFTCAVQSGSTFCPSLTVPTDVGPLDVVNQTVLAKLLPHPQYENSGKLRFRRPSAVLNMIYIGLSEAERAATISLRGAPKPKDPALTQREVYLKVVRRNLPAHGNERMLLPVREMRALQRFVRSPPPSPFEIPYEQVPVPPGTTKGAALPNQQKPNEPKPRAAVPPQRAAVFEPGQDLPSPLPVQYSSSTQHELMSRVWPVYEVHAYYDTGETVTVKGTKRKLLQALAPFGYLLHHEGPFYGFSDSLAGLGTELKQVAPDLYRVTIPNDGSVRIKTTLRAEERPKSECCNQKPPPVHVHVSPRGCYCRAPGGAGGDPRLLPLALLPVGLFFWRRKQRRKN